MRRPHTFTKKTIIKKSLNDVFAFFGKAENLNRITPPNLGFKIITPVPVTMRKGTEIEYRIKLNGIPFRWKSEITKWDPPFCFEDTQIKGPYKIWIHEHKFEEKNGLTFMTDTINYLSPGGIFEFIPHNLIVRKKVEAIFDYRDKIMQEIFSK